MDGAGQNGQSLLGLGTPKSAISHEVIDEMT